MKGIIFTLLEDVVTTAHGTATWAGLVDAAGVEGSYTSLGSYPDSEIAQLVAAAAAATGQSEADVLRWFGRAAMPLLAERFAGFFSGRHDARAFVCSLNTIIHPEVHKLYPGAACPHFDFVDAEDGALLIGYRSPRRMCALVEGFLLGVSDHYRQTAQIAHLACMAQGAPACRLHVRWDA